MNIDIKIKNLLDSVGWYSSQFPAMLQKAFSNSNIVISAWDDDKLVGLIRGMDDSAWQATLDCLLVNPAYQGQGIASKLAKELLEKYKDIMYIYVLPEDKKNVSFYQKCDFEIMANGTSMRIRNK